VPDDDATTLSFLHDSFRDWLAFRAARNGTIEVPDAFGPQWGAVAAHLAEEGQRNAWFVNACLADATVAARAAKREARGAVNNLDQLATDAFRTLVNSHLGPVDEHWGSMRVVSSESERGLRTLLAPEGAPDANPTETAVAGALLPYGSGPLRVAVTLFLGRMRGSLPSGLWPPTPIPSDAAELAQAIESYFARQREALERVAAERVPTLADRLLVQVGWRGLRGRVAKPVENGREIHHPFAYTYDNAGILVDVGDEPLAGTSHYSAAEDYLRGAPEQEAVQALAKALESMLPGFGP